RKVNFSVLPVTMSQVLAQENKGSVDIRWKALNQSNVKSYEIERGWDSYTFQNIGSIAAKEDGAAEINYSWSDKNPLSGKNYYRIKSVDIDGSFGYSPIVVVGVDGKAAAVRIFPNPVIGRSFQMQIV